MKSNYYSLFTLALMTLFIFACNSPDASKQETSEEETTEETTAQEEASDEVMSPQTALIITHEVADFDKWKVKYDEHATARQEAKMDDWALLTGRDNANMVTIIFKVGDMEAAKSFIGSEDLKAAMEGAGVMGQPNMRFSNVVFVDQEAAKSSNVRLYVQHKVRDFEDWKEVFDSKADMHSQAGVTPVAIARGVEDENDLTVVLTAADFETIENFVANPELKAAMGDAGVEGEPTFNYMNIHNIAF